MKSEHNNENFTLILSFKSPPPIPTSLNANLKFYTECIPRRKQSDCDPNTTTNVRDIQRRAVPRTKCLLLKQQQSCYSKHYSTENYAQRKSKRQMKQIRIINIKQHITIFYPKVFLHEMWGGSSPRSLKNHCSTTTCGQLSRWGFH